MNSYAHATWCDDIRQELGGKLTLVGVYSGALLVQSFPVTLPKLCLVLQVVIPSESSANSLKIQVLQNDLTIAEGEMATSELKASLAATATDDERSTSEAGKQLLVAAHFIFSPIRLEGPGAIRVRAQVGNEEIKANALPIAQMTESVDP